MLSLLVTICLLLPKSYAGQNWPSFRGPSASGIAKGFNTPVKWDIEKSENIRWKIDVPGLGHSCPVIWGDRIFVTTAVKDDGQSRLKVGLYGDVVSEKEDNIFSWRLYCIDIKNGKILWHRESHKGKPKVKRHPKSSHANAAPCTNGNYVVAFFGSEGMYCYGMEGHLVWKATLYGKRTLAHLTGVIIACLLHNGEGVVRRSSISRW